LKTDPFNVVDKYRKAAGSGLDHLPVRTPTPAPIADETAKLDAPKRFPGRTSSKTLSCDVDAGEIVAVEIASEVLGADIWLAFRDDFNPGDGKAIFYAHELPMLKYKTREQLQTIHKTKLAFGPGSKVRQ
jgi:hypothetical protein